MTETKRPGGWFGVFRILFGCLVVFAALRFFYNGWINTLYIQPTFHFSFPFFGWVKVLSPAGMYALFAVMIVCGAAIAINKYYRIACTVFFLVFTYTELIDVTYYLNHYYLVSLLSFIMIFYNNRRPSSDPYNQRILFFLKLQVSIVYFFGGINKIGADWLLHAQPLKIWLYAHSNMPLAGNLLAQEDTAFAAAWFSMIFDISVALMLWFRKTRLVAYALLSLFHVLTAILFNIGIFPWVMMIAALLFFENTLPLKHLFLLPVKSRGKFAMYALSCLAAWQLLFPLRHLLYQGNYLWTEQGFRFSWNIMLMEKNGSAEFGLRYPDGHLADVNERQYLTPFQQKMMNTQPDLILQFAAYLKKQEERKGAQITAVFAECYVSLNGRKAQLYFDPALNLITNKNELLQNIRSHHFTD